MDRTTLRNILVDLFNVSELHDLCFDLDIDYEQLEGEDKAGRARALILYCERHDHLPELEAACRKLPPKLFEQSLPPDGLPKQPIPHNLPPRSGFVGREREKAQIHEALCSRSYLISIDGIGGIGKSSLALEVAYECLNARREKSSQDIAIFDGFIWTTAKDRDLSLNALLDTIARTLDYPGIVQQPLEEKRHAARKLLQSRPYLLIVDNFETITDEGVRDFLLDLPEPSKVLITTREQKLRDVRSVSLKGLTGPEALTLIRNEGKRQGLASFELAEDRILLHLYQATGGAPLAIKWAVGQIKQKGQSLDTVLSALHEARGDIFDLLFARSWGLLSPDAQQVLLVMPLFATSATQAAIEAASDVRHFALDEALGQLVEMSLVEVTDELDRTRQRYGLHPLARAFAAAKLEQERDKTMAAWQRLAAFMRTFAQTYGGSRYREDYSQLEPELSNILATVEWCWQHQCVDLGTEIFRGVISFMGNGGYWDDMLALGQRAVQSANETGNELEAARLQMWPIAWVYRHRNDLDMAETHTRLAVFERFDDKRAAAHAKRFLGRIALARGQMDEAEQLFKEALTYFESTGDAEFYVCIITAYLAEVALKRQDLDTAWVLCNRVIPSARRDGDSVRITRLLGIMSSVAQQRGNLQEAKALGEEALALMKHINRADGVANSMLRLAQVEIAMRQEQNARQLLTSALEIYRRLGVDSKAQEARGLLDRLPEFNPEDRIQ
jgi:tetratricopeptide (TPR) repeat protein